MCIDVTDKSTYTKEIIMITSGQSTEERIDILFAHFATLRKNDVADVFGYIVLLMIQKGWLSFDDLLD